MNFFGQLVHHQSLVEDLVSPRNEEDKERQARGEIPKSGLD